MAEIDFSFLDDLFTDEDTTDYSYMFDDSDDGAVNLDFNYDPNNYGIGAFDVSSLFNDDDDFSYLFGSDDGIANLDFDYKPGVDFSDVYSSLFDEPADYDDTVKELYPDLFMDSTQDLIANADTSNNLLDTILGFVGGKKGKSRAQGIMQGVTGGITDFANSPIGQLLLYNYLKEQRKDDIRVPIGAEAYGDQGLGSMPDYRVFNIQPALMPGVAYANAPPPEMKHGGIHGAGKDDGPGDITLARLEPGEFVMTRKATENIGAKNLYNLMKQAERMG
tara:strand:- start:1000 stop:1830 length:831 start_codon:yes stop_codon:yes gene_type:complete